MYGTFRERKMIKQIDDLRRMSFFRGLLLGWWIAIVIFIYII